MNKVKNFFTAFALLFLVLFSLLLFAKYDFRNGGLDYNSNTGEFTILGDTYRISENFLKSTNELFDFNKTFMGEALFLAVKNALVFVFELCLKVLGTIFYLISFAINGGT